MPKMRMFTCQYAECDEILFGVPTGGTTPKYCGDHRREVKRIKQLKWYYEHQKGKRQPKSIPLEELREKFIQHTAIPEVKKTATRIIPDDFYCLDPRAELLMVEA